MRRGRRGTAIAFRDIRITDSQRVDIHYQISGESSASGELRFAANRAIPVDPDMLALALSTLCGRAYHRITVELRLTERTAAAIHAFTGAEVVCRERSTAPEWPERSGHVLNFSGGFDSLAALALMPDDAHLVSLDLGGRFARERKFFGRFDPTIIATNIVGTPFQRNSWSFMGLGSLLTAPAHHARYVTFGSILEAGAGNLRSLPVHARNDTFPPFAAAGYANAPYVGALTEVGTLMVLCAYLPEQAAASLVSLASPGDEKLYRKYVLAQIVADRMGVRLDLPVIDPPPVPPYRFGQSFAADFLSLYIGKHAGTEIRDRLVSDVPDEVDTISRTFDLTLFERVNTTLVRNFPAPLFGGLAGKLAKAGVAFYTERDWDEYRGIRGVLADHHPVVLT